MRACSTMFGLLFLIIFGSIFIAVGVGIGIFGARAATTAAERAERLEPLSAAAILDSSSGAEVLVEGRISARNRNRFRDFVVYIAEEYHGTDDDGDAKWREDERVTPPVLLEVTDKIVHINNDNYRIEQASSRWQENTTLHWNSFTGNGTKRYSGFIANAPVTVIGTIVSGTEGNEIMAEFIFGGVRAEYIAYQRQSAAMLPWMGLIFAGIGGFIVLIGSGLMLRRMLWGRSSA